MTPQSPHKRSVAPSHRRITREPLHHVVRCPCGWRGERKFQSAAPCPRCRNPELAGMRRPDGPGVSR